MSFDKVSFLSGVAVGRQLRGWPGSGTGRKDNIITAVMRVGTTIHTALSAVVSAGLGGTIMASISLVPSVITHIGTITIPPALGEAATAELTYQEMADIVASASATEELGGTITITNVHMDLTESEE